jgi:2-dehydro-3-deoxygluconokinase
MSQVVAFGEIMLRLSTPGFQRFTQVTSFDASFGGGEANVAISLANFGVDARYVTVLPTNPLGDLCVRFLRSFGVDTSRIVRTPGRIGIYFLETGAVQRPSAVLYDRAASCIALAKRGDIDWQDALAGAKWFHWTGITPAISQGAADLCHEAVCTAKQLGLTVSCDLNYRSKLWKYGKSAGEVMGELMRFADVAIANEEDAEQVFGIKAPKSDVHVGKVDAEDYRYVASELMKRFPNLKKVAITLRGSISASHNTWSGVLYDGTSLVVGPTYDITHIVDRVGGGDSFAAGLIYAMLCGKSDQDAVSFAVAASCLKHTIPGDASHVSVAEVEALLKQGGAGRVQR